MSDGWFCRNCGELDGTAVRHDESCDYCGVPVYVVSLNKFVEKEVAIKAFVHFLDFLKENRVITHEIENWLPVFIKSLESKEAHE